MSDWICCNCCFLCPGGDRKLALTTCGHIICNICYQKGRPEGCLICGSRCQLSALSDKSPPEVKALFSGVSCMVNTHLTEVSRVLSFQARHLKTLQTGHKKQIENLEELSVQMRLEMQQMTNKLNEQRAYIVSLEKSLHQQRLNQTSSGPHKSLSLTPQGHRPVLQFPFDSPVSSNIHDNMKVDERSQYRKPHSDSRLSLFNPPPDGQRDSFRSPVPGLSTKHSACSASVSRFQGASFTPNISFSRSSSQSSLVFHTPPSFRHSLSSLALPLP